MSIRASSVLLAIAAIVCTLLVSIELPAEAGCAPFEDCSSDGSGDGDGKPTETPSTPTKTAKVKDSGRSCSVYGNSAGMGYACVKSGKPTGKSLRERFGGQKFQGCRYSDVPDALKPAHNPDPDKGRYMLMSCLNDVDFDTYSGGRDRVVDISVVFVENGTDVADRHNAISTFLWNQAESSAQMPVPFLETKPNERPLVGTPTYFTFKWLDPATKEVTAEGPYSDRNQGGPFKELTANGMRLQAKATKIHIDPNQKGIKDVTCSADTPYQEGAPADEQPGDACKITFPRTSASAEKYATKSIPSEVDDAFYLSIDVTWKIEYGTSKDSMKTLGDGFEMRMHQQLPVQEVQALNQPPFSLY